MDLSIIILNYKSHGLCKTCIRGIKKLDISLNYEIIVVDNGSDNEVKDSILKAFSEVVFIQTGSNLGHSKGNNIGIQKAKGRYILILNPDIAVFDNAFESMVEYMDSNPSIGILGCKLLNPDKTTQMSCRKFYRFSTPIYSRTFLGKLSKGKKHMRDFLMTDFSHDSNLDVDWIQGSCMLLRKTMIDSIGGFDERFFLYFSDVDLCKRAWLEGYRVHYMPEVKIVHYFHRESAGGIKMFLYPVGRLHIKDWIQYLIKYSKSNNTINA